MSRRDDTQDPAIDEPAGDETVVGGPRAQKEKQKRKKFLPSDSAIKTAIYQPEQHGERPRTIPEGTDQLALEQPDLTATTVAVPERDAGLTTDPGQRARVLDVHDKAERLLAELDATANIKVGHRASMTGTAETVDPTAPTVEDHSVDPITEEEDDDEALEEPETVVNGPAAQKAAGYPPRLPQVPTHTPAPGEVGSVDSTVPGVAPTPPPGAISRTPAPGAIAHTPAPGSMAQQHPLAADVADDAAGLATIETGWSPPAPNSQSRLAPVAPRPMPMPPMQQRRSVGSVLLAPFRAIASWFKPPQPNMPPSQANQRQHIPDGLSNIQAQTYTEAGRMVQRRRKAPTSGPPPEGEPDDR